MIQISYVLTDPRSVAARAPYTFFLPSEAELAAVGPGDLVKLTFDYPHATETWSGERMWLIVESANGDDLVGILDNNPDEATSPLNIGDRIKFKRYHVLAIDWKTPDAAPPAPQYRTYWERCLVDQCVLDGEEPVEFLYREEPEPTSEEDDYPDSGWRIRGRKAKSTDADMEARDVAFVAVGAVLNRDDSWIGLIDAPFGIRLIRDFETNCYVEES